MRLRPLFLALAFAIASHARAADHAAVPEGVAPDDALAKLKAGNERFAAGESKFPNVSATRRCETNDGGQHPFAAVLTCADSRVPPELLFDAGLGDLFVVRVAGNVAATDEVGTLEYGVGHLGTKLIVVMGHTSCGAVTAVVKHAHVEPNIEKLVAPIAPAVVAARAANPGGSDARILNESIRENVKQSIRELTEQSETIRAAVEKGDLKIVGAVYDIHLGTIDWIGGETSSPSFAAKAEPHEPTAEGHETKPEPAAKPAHEPAAARATVDAHEPADPHEAKAAGEHETSHESTAHDAPTHAAPSHDEPKHAEADHGEPNHAEPEHAEAKPTLMQRQGLMLPLAFMAAGSALSGTIVYAIGNKSRAATTVAAPTAQEPAHAPSH